MQIDVAPETERLVREEINSGHFRSVDELITAGVQAWREKQSSSQAQSVTTSAAEARNLVELFENSPFKGLNIEFERDRLGP